MRPASGNIASSCLKKKRKWEAVKPKQRKHPGRLQPEVRNKRKVCNRGGRLRQGLGAMTHAASGPPGGFRSPQPAAPPLPTAHLRSFTGRPRLQAARPRPWSRDTWDRATAPHAGRSAGSREQREGAPAPANAHWPSRLPITTRSAERRADGDFRRGRSDGPRAGPRGGGSRPSRAAALQGEPWTARAGRWWCATTALG